MEARQCPGCGLRWHSSEGRKEWTCTHCGGQMTDKHYAPLGGRENNAYYQSDIERAYAQIAFRRTLQTYMCYEHIVSKEELFIDIYNALKMDNKPADILQMAGRQVL